MPVLGEIWPLLFGMPNIVFTVGWLIAMTAIAATQWRKYAQSREENELKRQMLERGCTTEEIERVIRAAAVRDDEDGD